MSVDCVFRLLLTDKCTLKSVHSKSPVHGHDPKFLFLFAFLFLHQYKTGPLVYNKNTIKWSSTAQI